MLYAGDTVDLFASNKNRKYLDELKAIFGRNIFLAGINISHGHNEESWWGRLLDKPTMKINEFVLRKTNYNIQNRGRSVFARKYGGKKYVPYLYNQMMKIIRQTMSVIDEYKDGYFNIVITVH